MPSKYLAAIGIAFAFAFALASAGPALAHVTVDAAIRIPSAGDVVRGTDPVAPSQAAAADQPELAKLRRDVNDATTDGVIGIVLGSVGLLMGVAALVVALRGGRRSGGTASGGQ